MNTKQILMSALLLGASVSYSMAQAVDTTSTGSETDRSSAMSTDSDTTSTTMGTDDADMTTPDSESTMERDQTDVSSPSTTEDTDESTQSPNQGASSKYHEYR